MACHIYRPALSVTHCTSILAKWLHVYNSSQKLRVDDDSQAALIRSAHLTWRVNVHRLHSSPECLPPHFSRKVITAQQRSYILWLKLYRPMSRRRHDRTKPNALYLDMRIREPPVRRHPLLSHLAVTHSCFYELLLSHPLLRNNIHSCLAVYYDFETPGRSSAWL